MKRIIDGMTYNTDTSTRIAEAKWEHDDEIHTGVLYQTLGGAFFVDDEIAKQVWNQHDEQHEERVEHTFEPMSQEDAHKWMLDGEVEVFNNPFDDPPEATAEAEPGATIYIRAPASLKRRVDDAARASKVSGNVWAMRCVEQCLAEASRGSRTPAWVLRDPTVHAVGDDHQVALSIAEGWPLAMLTKAHAALLGRQLLKAVAETK